MWAGATGTVCVVPTGGLAGSRRVSASIARSFCSSSSMRSAGPVSNRDEGGWPGRGRRWLGRTDGGLAGGNGASARLGGRRCGDGKWTRKRVRNRTAARRARPAAQLARPQGPDKMSQTAKDTAGPRRGTAGLGRVDCARRMAGGRLEPRRWDGEMAADLAIRYASALPPLRRGSCGGTAVRREAGRITGGELAGHRPAGRPTRSRDHPLQRTRPSVNRGTCRYERAADHIEVEHRRVVSQPTPWPARSGARGRNVSGHGTGRSQGPPPRSSRFPIGRRVSSSMKPSTATASPSVAPRQVEFEVRGPQRQPQQASGRRGTGCQFRRRAEGRVGFRCGRPHAAPRAATGSRRMARRTRDTTRRARDTAREARGNQDPMSGPSGRCASPTSRYTRLSDSRVRPVRKTLGEQPSGSEPLGRKSVVVRDSRQVGAERQHQHDGTPEQRSGQQASPHRRSNSSAARARNITA